MEMEGKEERLTCVCDLRRQHLPWPNCARCSARVTQHRREDVRARAWSLPHPAVWSLEGCDPSRAPAAASCFLEPSLGYPACMKCQSLTFACPGTPTWKAAKFLAGTLPLTLQADLHLTREVMQACQQVTPDAVCFLSAQPQACMYVPAGCRWITARPPGRDTVQGFIQSAESPRWIHE